MTHHTRYRGMQNHIVYDTRRVFKQHSHTHTHRHPHAVHSLMSLQSTGRITFVGFVSFAEFNTDGGTTAAFEDATSVCTNVFINMHNPLGQPSSECEQNVFALALVLLYATRSRVQRVLIAGFLICFFVVAFTDQMRTTRAGTSTTEWTTTASRTRNDSPGKRRAYSTKCSQHHAHARALLYQYQYCTNTHTHTHTHLVHSTLPRCRSRLFRSRRHAVHFFTSQNRARAPWLLCSRAKTLCIKYSTLGASKQMRATALAHAFRPTHGECARTCEV